MFDICGCCGLPPQISRNRILWRVGRCCRSPVDWGHLVKSSGQRSRTALPGKSRERSIPRVRRGRMSRPLSLRPTPSPTLAHSCPRGRLRRQGRCHVIRRTPQKDTSRNCRQSTISGPVSRGGSGRQDDSEIRRRRRCTPINRAGRRPLRVSRSGSQIEPRDENRCDSQPPDPGGRHRLGAAALAHIRSPVGQRLSRLMDHHRLRARVWQLAPGPPEPPAPHPSQGPRPDRGMSALTAPRFWKSEAARLLLPCGFRGARQSTHATVGVPSGARAGCSGSAHPGDGQGEQNARRHRGGWPARHPPHAQEGGSERGPQDQQG